MDEQEKKQSSNFMHSAKSGAPGKSERSHYHRGTAKEESTPSDESALMEEKQQELEKTSCTGSRQFGWMAA